MDTGRTSMNDDDEDNGPMTHDDMVNISRDKFRFNMHMMEFSGRTDKAIEILERNDAEQFRRLNRLEREPRRTKLTAGGIAAIISAVAIGIVETFRAILHRQ